MSVALHGNLRDFGIGEVFQLIGQQRKTGILEVNGDSARLRLAFDGGAVVWGETAGAYDEAGLGEMLVRTGILTPERLLEIERGIQDRDARLSDVVMESGEISSDQLEDTLDLVTRDTVFELLRWSSGSFHFTAQPLAHQRDAGRLMPAEQILMDGLRMVDEWHTLDPEVVDPTSIFERVGHFDAYRQGASESSPEQMARAERLFLLIDGRRRTGRVIDLSRLGRFEGARMLSDLRGRGMIAPRAIDAQEGRKRRRVSSELSAGPSPVAIALSVLPFLLLATMVAVLWLRGPSLVEGTARAELTPSPEHRAAYAFELLRLRNATEAYRFARGEWPSDLADLDGLPPVFGAHMAPPVGRQYYYDQRGETFLVLAPEE